MKKVLGFLFSLLLILALAIPAFAAENEIREVRLSGISLPVAGEKVGASIQADAKVILSVKGESEHQEKTIPATAIWSEGDREEPLKSTDAFVAGRTYRITVELSFEEELPAVNGETKFYINQKEAGHKSNQGNSVFFTCDFVATPASFSPKVSLEIEGGEKTKEYDGKGITLFAKVEKIEGVEYRYEWFFDSEKISDAKSEKLTVKNVSQSGEYHCKVYASPSGSSSEKSTVSATCKIKITPCIVTLEIQNAEKNLFDPDPEFTYEILGEIYDELEGKLSRMEGEDLGKYSILIGTLSFPEEVAENYELRVEQGTLTILDVGSLPFESVKNVADQSYITGKNGAKIRVSATRGAIAEDAILTLSLPAADTKENVESALGKKVLKSISIGLVDESGKKLSLSRHATLKIQIPLSEEEEAFDLKTIKAAFFDTSAKELKTEVVKTGEISYLVVSITDLGSVFLLEGEKALTEKDSNEKSPQKKSGAVWMWVLIIVVSVLSAGAIVFTVIWTQKNRKPIEKKKPAPAPEKPKEIPAKKDLPEEAKKSEKPAPEKKISFEDLED